MHGAEAMGAVEEMAMAVSLPLLCHVHQGCGCSVHVGIVILMRHYDYSFWCYQETELTRFSINENKVLNNLFSKFAYRVGGTAQPL